MAPERSAAEPPRGPTQPSAERRASEAIDIQRLADKVYKLMLADLRLERARGAAPPQRRER